MHQPNPPTRPGAILARVIADMPPAEKAEFLVYLERKSRIEKDKGVLDVIEDYKSMISGRPLLRLVTTDDDQRAK